MHDPTHVGPARCTMCVRSDAVEDSAAADPASGAPPPAQCRLLGEPDAVTGVSNAPSPKPVVIPPLRRASYAPDGRRGGVVPSRATPAWSPGRCPARREPAASLRRPRSPGSAPPWRHRPVLAIAVFGQIASHDLAVVAVVLAVIMAVLAAAWFVLRRRGG